MTAWIRRRARASRGRWTRTESCCSHLGVPDASRLLGGGALDNCDLDTPGIGTDALNGALGMSFTVVNYGSKMYV
jgi:hypothetical protein